MAEEAVKRTEKSGQDPVALLILRTREAESRAINGEVTVKVSYRDGQKTGCQSTITENFK